LDVEADSALAAHLAVLADAESDGDRTICARAHFVLAWTYDRFADIPKSQAAAKAAAQLLGRRRRPAWGV
jgi:hypothetical protein